MNFLAAVELMKQGKKITKKGWDDDKYIYLNLDGSAPGKLGDIILSSYGILGTYAFDSINIQNDDYELYVEEDLPSLTKEETLYLRNVIEPVKSNVKYIYKTSASGNHKEYIFIDLDDTFISLFAFNQGEMFKGLKLKKKYSLEELDLDKYEVVDLNELNIR